MVGEFSNLMIKLGVNMSELKAGLDASSRIVEQFANRSTLSAQKLGTAFFAMGTAMAGALAIAVKQASNLENAVTSAAIMTGKTGKAFDDTTVVIKDMAKALGTDTVYSATEAAQAMGMLADKGIDPVVMGMENIKSVMDLAYVSEIGISQASNMVTQAMRSFGLGVESTNSIVNTLAYVANNSATSVGELGSVMRLVGPAAKSAGMSFAETTSTLGALANAGMTTMQASRGLRSVLNDLIVPNKNLIAVLGELNLSTADASIKTHGFAGVLDNLSKAGITSEQVLRAFGGQSGNLVNSLFAVGANGEKAYLGINKLNSGLNEAGKYIDEITQKKLKTFTAQWELIKGNIQDVSITIGEVFLPKITELAHSLKIATDGMQDWMKANPVATNKLTLLAASLTGVSLAIGALGMAFRPLTNVIGAIGTLGVKLVLLDTGLKTLGTSATIFANVLGGILAIEIAGVIYLAGQAVKVLWEWYDASEAIKKSSVDLMKQEVDFANKWLEKAEKMKNQTGNLATVKKMEIAGIQGSIIVRKQELDAMIKKGDYDKEEYENITKLLRVDEQRLSSIAKEIGWKEELVKTNDKVKASVIDLGSKQNAVNEAVSASTLATWELKDKLHELNTQFEEGKLTADEYKNKITELSTTYSELIGKKTNIEDLVKKFNEMDLSVDIDLKVEPSLDSIKGVDAIIKQMQNEVANNQLGNDGMVIESSDNVLENRLKNVALAVEADRLEAENKIALLQVEWDARLNKSNKEEQLMIEESTREAQVELDKASSAVKAEEDRYERQRLTLEMTGTLTEEALAKETLEHEKNMFALTDIEEAKRAVFEQTLADRGRIIQEKFGEEQALLNIQYEEYVANEDRKILLYSEYAEKLKTMLQDPHNKEIEAMDKKAKASTAVADTVVANSTREAQAIQGVTGALIAQQQVILGARTFLGSEQSSATGSVIGGNIRTYVGTQTNSTTPGEGGSTVPYTGINKTQARQAARTAHGYASGTDFVPSTGMYQLHRGEKVIPAEQNKGGSITIINQIDKGFIDEMINPNTIINIISSDIARRGVTRRVIKGVK